MRTSKGRGEAAAQMGNDPTGLMLAGPSYLHAQSRKRWSKNFISKAELLKSSSQRRARPSEEGEGPVGLISFHHWKMKMITLTMNSIMSDLLKRN
ncbi:hypothetical protein N1E91_11815 [Pseudomonas aeruginosa]|nr:hypothetical protein [Pseudomonas aeruginosa]MCS9139132.1 hypothetical protein [Pseudomonas aeruginosa]MCS9211887.1 hypothetical protein [Pseudomonas aeruginosa]